MYVQEMTVGRVMLSVVLQPRYPPSCPWSRLIDPTSTPIFRLLLLFSSQTQDTVLLID